MALILNIDTATELASVALCIDDKIMELEESTEQKNHASFIQPAIKKICADTDTKLSLIDAVAVTAGPGSYTGLRVGLSSAKGLCFALNKPLILVNTLEVMATSLIKETENQKQGIKGFLFCPMIDARRNEVFTAIYDYNLHAVLSPVALLLDENSFEKYLGRHIFFSGTGSIKLKKILSHPDMFFSEIQHNAGDMAKLSFTAFVQKGFASLAYSEPLYLKEFFTPAKKA